MSLGAELRAGNVHPSVGVEESALLGRRPYLPESWTQDPARRARHYAAVNLATALCVQFDKRAVLQNRYGGMLVLVPTAPLT